MESRDQVLTFLYQMPAPFLRDNKRLKFWYGRFPAIQPFRYSLILISPWSLGYIRKLAVGSPWGNYFTPGLCSANIRRPGLSNLHRHFILRVPIHAMIEWSLGDSFLVPRKIHVRALQISQFSVERATKGPTSPAIMWLFNYVKIFDFYNHNAFIFFVSFLLE